MRMQEKNKRSIFYAEYVGKGEAIKDEYGNETGEYKTVYSEPNPFKVNVSVGQGEYFTMVFGNVEIYDKVIVIDNLNCPITKTSILWIDSLDTTNPHDYKVTGVFPSLNSTLIAVKRVNVSA